jgi:small subunit ribosomal protein S8
MITDPIGDFLTRIRNALERKKDTVELPSTKILVKIADILKKEGFIVDYKVEEGTPQSTLVVELKYVNGEAAIREATRLSKPGIRKYKGYREMKTYKHGLGIEIYTTPLGVMTSEEARKSKVGGECLLRIS